MSIRTLSRVFATLALASSFIVAAGHEPAWATPAPPGQPTSGPGGSNYCFTSGETNGVNVIAGKQTDSPTENDYWIYQPKGSWDTACGASAPTVVPLVVVLHGLSDGSNSYYDHYIRHIVRKRGAIVVYPRYQPSAAPNLPTSPADPASNAIDAINDAITTMSTASGIRIDTTKGLGVIGNSWGATTGFNVVARASAGVPSWATPKFFFAVAPGMIGYRNTENPPHPELEVDSDVSHVPTTMRFACMTGDRDVWPNSAGEQGCDKLFKRLKDRGVTGREILRVRSDFHGWPPLIANHEMMVENPGWAGDALDWYGTWKIGEAYVECTQHAISGSCSYAYGGTSDETSLGYFTDGGVTNDPVNPIVVTTTDDNIECTAAPDPFATPPTSYYTPCANFRYPASSGYVTGDNGNGLESNQFAARTKGGGYPSGATYASSVNSTWDAHRFWDFALDQDVAAAMRNDGSEIVVDGIEVQADWWADSTAGSPFLWAEVSWDGGTTWAAKSSNVGTTSNATYTFGGATDTWGHTWDVHHVANDPDLISEIGDGSFQVRLTTDCGNYYLTPADYTCYGVRDFNVDAVRAKVYWHARPNIVTNGGFELAGSWTNVGYQSGCINAGGTGGCLNGGTSGVAETLTSEYLLNNSTGSTKGQAYQAVSVPSTGTYRLQALGKVLSAGQTGSVSVWNSTWTTMYCYVQFTSTAWTFKTTTSSPATDCSLTSPATVNVLLQSDAGANWRLDVDSVKLAKVV
ncbi:MAG: hypothetical protein QOK28_2650 [Actinomycetota bacterium]